MNSKKIILLSIIISNLIYCSEESTKSSQLSSLKDSLIPSNGLIKNDNENIYQKNFFKIFFNSIFSCCKRKNKNKLKINAYLAQKKTENDNANTDGNNIIYDNIFFDSGSFKMPKEFESLIAEKNDTPNDLQKSLEKNSLLKNENESQFSFTD